MNSKSKFISPFKLRNSSDCTDKEIFRFLKACYNGQTILNDAWTHIYF